MTWWIFVDEDDHARRVIDCAPASRGEYAGVAQDGRDAGLAGHHPRPEVGFVVRRRPPEEAACGLGRGRSLWAGRKGAKPQRYSGRLRSLAG